MKTGEAYENYQPAYRFGWESRSKHPGKTFEQAQPHLERDWGNQRTWMEWTSAQQAVRDAWEHVKGND